MRFFALASLLICACGNPLTIARSRPANPTAPRWEQFCESFAFRTVADYDEVVATLGAEGWELAAALNSALCFKRPAGLPRAAPLALGLPAYR